MADIEFTGPEGQNRQALAKRPEVFCSRCGAEAGQKILCTGTNQRHYYKLYPGVPHCEYCGQSVGEAPRCLKSGNLTHNFVV
jgi:hypothetical protein